jgi:hypothetical protein
MKIVGLLFALLATSVITFGQGQLALNHFCVALNGKEVNYIPESILELSKGNRHEIKLFENEGLIYGVVLEFRKRGNKARLIKRSFVETVNGKRRYSRKSTITSHIDPSQAVVFSGRSSGHLTYDPVHQKNIFTSYNFHLNY